MKKIIFYINITCIVICLTLITSHLLYSQEDLFTQAFEVQNEKFSALENLRASNCVSAEEILEFLLPPKFDLPAVLQHDFYKRTNYVNVDSLLDSPILGNTRIYTARWQLQTDVFYNHMEQAFFTKESPFISSIINFDNPDLIQALKNAEQFGLPDLSGTLNLFKTFKLQQRRAGFMLAFSHAKNNWYFAWKMPFYYLERNFFLTPDEAQKIKSAPAFKQAENEIEENDNDTAAQEFALKHLVADRLGIGDSRFVLQHPFYITDSTNAFLGIKITVPTAITFKRGILGGKFCKDFSRPAFSIQEVAQLLIGDRDIAAATTIATNFAIGALDQLIANVADRQLGNEGHFGLGPKIDIFKFFDEHVALELHASAEYLIPANETRYFIQKKDPAIFNKVVNNYETILNDPNSTAEQIEAAAEQTLAFLNQQLINTLYPFVVRTRVQPGPIYKITPTLHVAYEKFNAWIGYDYWAQGQESIPDLHQSGILGHSLRIERGTRSSASQHKLFADIWAQVYSNTCSDWQFIMKIDNTLSTSGIGENITISLGLQINC